jgi:tetratricopeptide (TPR) repeat protein
LTFEAKRLEKKPDQQNRGESKTRLVEQINVCLKSGDYARAHDLLRGAASEFPNDVELSELAKRVQDGNKRKAEADALITESQELFAQRKSAEAIQLLRKAYELDKSNSLARSILANALVEHAYSIIETDWLEAETLANQALALNPAHPTAKTIRGTVEDRKKASSVDAWVEQASKRQSSGDLFAALAWVAEGLAVHPDDPKLLQIQDAIQRDQAARRRQARRGDLEDLRRMEREIAGANDVAAKQALAERIQAVAAKHWTDGEILSIANALLLRLGLVPKEGSTASPLRKGATVILHVPRPNAPEAPVPAPNQAPSSPILPSQAPLSPVLSAQAPPSQVKPDPTQTENPPSGIDTPIKAAVSVLPPVPVKVPPPEPKLPPPQIAKVAAAEPPAPSAKVSSLSSRSTSQPKQPTRSKATTLILVSAAAVIVTAAILYIARGHHAPQVAKAPAAEPSAAAPNVSAPPVSAQSASAPVVSPPADSFPAPTSSESPLPAAAPSSDTGAGTRTPEDQARANQGTLVVVAGQDNAKVLLNGKLQRQLTQGGQLRVPNLEPNDYVVQVSKSGFQDTPQQKIHIRKGEQTTLVFNLQPQPQPQLASLSIQGGTPGTTVLVDQTAVGTIQPDGTLSVSSVNPGDHTVELRKDRFKPRQFREHFVAGGAISLAAADAALEAVPGELKVTFTPPDAKVAIVKGEHLTIVSSGVPLNLAAGTYTLTARTADRFTRTGTFEVVAGQSKTLDLSLGPNGMSRWEDPTAWRHEGDSFLRKGGDFVLYGDGPASGTFVFSAMPGKGHLLQWVLNYTDPKNYILFQMDDNNFYRAVIRNGAKTDEIKVSDKGDKKSFRTLQIRVSPTEIVHQVKHGDFWTVLDRWTQAGANLGLGKFGFYIPGNDEVALSNFVHYADLNIH